MHHSVKKPRNHQPQCSFRFNGGSSMTRTVTAFHLIIQPTQVKDLVHKLQDVVIGNVVRETSGNEKRLFTCGFLTKHCSSPGVKVTNDELHAHVIDSYQTGVCGADFFNSPTEPGCML